MSRWLSPLFIVVVACSSPVPRTPVHLSAVIGSDGGSLESGLLRLEVPFDAVDQPRTFTLDEASELPPRSPLSRMYVLTSDGGAFSHVLKLRVPAAAAGSLYLSNDDGGWDEIGGELVVDGGAIEAGLVHLGRVFASPSTGLRTLWGVQRECYQVIDGIVSAPRPFVTNVEAYVERDGGFDRYLGVLQSDGTFFVPHVPRGITYVHGGQWWVAMVDSTADLSSYRSGRPDVESENGAPGTLIMNVAGMTPWERGDRLWLDSFGAGLYFFGSSYDIDAGQTAVTVVGRSWGGGPLIDGSRGDRLLANHFVTRFSDAGTEYSAVGETVTFAAFTQGAGATMWLSGTFDRSVPELTATVDVDFPAFASVADAGFLWFGVAAATDPRRPPWRQVLAAEISDAPVDSFRFSVPAADPARRVATLRTGAWDLRQCDPQGNFIQLTWEITDVRPLEATGRWSPRLSRVVEPTINGRPFAEDRSGIGSSVVIEWKPPLLGADVSYEVVVNSFLPDTNLCDVALNVFQTTLTRIRLPPGLLLPAGKLIVTIYARTPDGATAAITSGELTP